MISQGMWDKGHHKGLGRRESDNLDRPGHTPLSAGNSFPRDPPVLKILRRVNFGTGRKFGTDVAKRYGEGSEMPCFSRKKRQENGTDIEKLRRWQNTTDSCAVLFLVRKGPLGYPEVRNEKAAQRVSFGAGYPADVHADIPADVQGQKLRSGPQNPGKTSISVRTSMTRRRGRPRPEGGERKLRSEKLRAEIQFSFPMKMPSALILKEIHARSSLISEDFPSN